MKRGYEVALALENYYHTEALDQCKTEESCMFELIRHNLKIEVLEKQFEEEER